MTGEAAEWPDRYLFIQQSRPDANGWNVPRPYTHCAVRGQQYKVVMSAVEETFSSSVGFGETELYDLKNDPGEEHKIARQNSDVVFQMRKRYEDWFWDVTQGLNPPVRNHLDTLHENPVKLATQNMRGAACPLRSLELDPGTRDGKNGTGRIGTL